MRSGKPRRGVQVTWWSRDWTAQQSGKRSSAMPALSRAATVARSRCSVARTACSSPLPVRTGVSALHDVSPSLMIEFHSPEGVWSRIVAGPSGATPAAIHSAARVGACCGGGGGSIGGDDDAGGRWGRADQVEGGGGEAVGEQAVSGAQDERMDREQVLVDEAERAQRLDQRTAAHDVEVVAWALLELGDRRGDVTAEQRRVGPRQGLGQAIGGDVLGGVVEGVAERAVLGVPVA